MRGARSFTDSEIDLIKSHITNLRDYTLFVIGLKTGLRISEILSIRVSDVIQFEKPVSHLTIARCNMKGKRSSRTIAMHPEVQASVLKLIQEHSLNPDDYLFQSRKGVNRPITSVQAWRILKTIFRACKLQGKCSTHSCRKTMARKAFAATGNNLVKTQHILGHMNVSSTISYLDIDSDEIDSIVLSLM